MKKIILIIILIFSLNIIAQDRKSDFFITAGANLNLNMYSSDFKQLNGIRSNSPGYSNTSALGTTFYLGGEYLLDKNLDNSELRYGLKLAYSDLSATYNVNEKIANYLLENEALSVIVNHHLAPSIKYLMLENYVNYLLIDKLFVNLGFQLGIPFVKTYEQYEQLLEPTSAHYKNGSDYDFKSSGDIPDFSSIYLALSVGARYEFARVSNIGLNAEINYNYGLTNLATSMDWKANTLRAGISAVYQIGLPEFKKPIDPPKPPMPDMLPPPALVELLFDLKMYNNDLTLNNEDTLHYEEKYNNLIKYETFLPIIYFNHSQDELSNYGKNILDRLADNMKLKNDKSLKVTLATIDEEASVLDKRFDNIKKYLINAGIPSDRIQKPSFYHPKKKSDNQDVLAESQYAKFEFDGLIYHKTDQNVTVAYSSQNLKIQPIIMSASENVKIDVSISADNGFEAKFNEQGGNFDIEYKDLKPSKKIRIDAIVKDAENQSKSISKELNVSIKPVLSNEIYNLKTNNPREAVSKVYEELVLGYFDFDSYEFSYTDSFVKDYIIKSLKNGKRVFLLPLTDNFGSVEYNLDLAKKRANSALKFLDLQDEHLMVEYPDSYLFDNKNPESRIKNRSIVVRIY